jgi:class 3 adenylate cyclase
VSKKVTAVTVSLSLILYIVFYEAQLDQLRSLLHDLLQPSVASAMINISARPPPENCHAAVLQLDICGFTDLSQTITPMQLALLMHKLFTYFDDTVHANWLFKMDTVGDAYIVAALLPEGDAQRSCACHGMLEVAKAMISGLERHYQETGQRVHCRIGVAIGEVTTGVLGHLQTRFHITGPGLQAAEMMEQTSPVKDSLHASDAFIDAVRQPSGELLLHGWAVVEDTGSGGAREGPRVRGTCLVPVPDAPTFSACNPSLSPPLLVFEGVA